MHPLQIFNDVAIVFRAAYLWNSQEVDQFLFRHKRQRSLRMLRPNDLSCFVQATIVKVSSHSLFFTLRVVTAPLRAFLLA